MDGNLSRRQLFALSAALAGTALTAAAAIAGLTRPGVQAPPAQTVSQIVTPSGPVRAEPVEPGG
jgi:hypothetical protein